MGLQGWGLTEVRGADAEGWLNDLVTASIDRLAEGEALRSFLLSPTGRIRADVYVLPARAGEGFLLLQGPGQPDAIADLLAPYVLSSEVELAPSDPSGLDLGPRPGPVWTAGWEADAGSVTAGPEALESWRIRHGLARFPVDLDRGFAARRGRARRRTGDRSDQGLLPRPGVGCTGAEPRAPAAGGARGASRDPAPARLAGPFERGGRGVRHQRGAPRRPRGDRPYPLGRKGKGALGRRRHPPGTPGDPDRGTSVTTRALTFQDCSRSNTNGTTVSCAHGPPPGRLRQPDEAAGG